MKKILLLILSAVGLSSCSILFGYGGQSTPSVKISYLVNHHWSQWKELLNEYELHRLRGGGNYSYDDITYIPYKNGSVTGAEWERCGNWRITIKNYIPPTKKELKKARKTNKWFEYEGTFEYYVSDEYPDLKSQLVEKGGFFTFKPFVKEGGRYAIRVGDDGSLEDVFEGPTAKRSVKATIKIAPYRWYPKQLRHPRVYNVYIGDVGFALDLGPNFIFK